MTFRASWIAQSRSDEIAIMEGPPSSYHRIPELLLYSIAPLAMLVTAPLLARGLGPVARGNDTSTAIPKNSGLRTVFLIPT